MAWTSILQSECDVLVEHRSATATARATGSAAATATATATAASAAAAATATAIPSAAERNIAVSIRL